VPLYDDEVGLAARVDTLSLLGAKDAGSKHRPDVQRRTLEFADSCCVFQVAGRQIVSVWEVWDSEVAPGLSSGLMSWDN
jgi:hypothetical protein